MNVEVHLQKIISFLLKLFFEARNNKQCLFISEKPKIVHGYTGDLKFAGIADYLYLIFSVQKSHFKMKIYFQS